MKFLKKHKEGQKPHVHPAGINTDSENHQQNELVRD